ncbi:deoxyribodipyrimidine photo-lyase [Polymorphobacter multimanifer]|uniref:Deoxyribodipyrimidine photo-lyase n=2 Tax=Polymorphobacter multimanifer TaxID=1070431 RepID=A0A841LH91_9SPHN|nr:deoxyribodipyrimidine photo-lyase [Polymorphobacter multimanifer]
MEIVWFKRDLRVHDHAPLTAAAAAASGRPVLPLYIIEPSLWAQADMSGRQFAFLAETLADLDRSLAARGARLVVRVGEAVAVLDELHKAHGVHAVHAHEETGNLWSFARDRAVRRWARGAGVGVHEVRQHGVWRALDNRNDWAARWDAMMAAPRLPAPAAIRCADVPSDAMPDAAALGLADDPCPGRQRGGRREGLALLKGFFESRGRRYRAAMSAPESGAAHCSRLSPHLAQGSISMREAYQAALAARLRWRAADDAMFVRAIDSFVSRLHWHCHFIQKLEDAPWLEARCLHPAYDGVHENEGAALSAWAGGMTGWPFVDACMRSLAATGWLNFRMRAMVMSVASHHLRLDWRQTGAVLARMFTDYEPGIHWAQVQMQSGTTGTNIPRIYNPVKQGHDQDANGDFIRRWVPELAGLATPWLHEPWKAPPELRGDLGYPGPIADHEVAARAARAAIAGIRRDPAHAPPACAILVKHGSRKAGLPDANRRRGKPASGQRELDL